MFFFPLAFLALTASATLVNVKRDIEPALDTLRAITAELKNIDFDVVEFETQTSATNIALAFVIDGQFAAVHAVTLDASLQVLACTSLNGVASDTDTESFIKEAQATYEPTILDVLNKTIEARPEFAALDFVSDILADLIRYNGSNSLYLGNLTMATSPPWLPTAQNITKTITMAFNEAIEAYSDSTSTSTSTPNATSTSAKSATSISSTTKSITSSATSSPPPASTAPADAFGQCGGLGWIGTTTCVPGYTCTVLSDFYSQCL
ncbi:hypothetical protein K438DRAFT_1963702 [Mycena galopus ATCC 62051]|nr:hypothetical protein K438DRAFT_1963702 [Mycena galopus ATCC 62051]